MISVAASAVYLVGGSWLPQPAHTASKGLAILPLAALAFRKNRLLLALALLCSSAGDVLLDLGAAWFVFGLAAFLLAHVLYSVKFLRHRARIGTKVRRPLYSALVLVYALALTVYLAPALGDLLAPVVLYVVAITTMVVCAAHAGYESWSVVAGAILFLISDSILGVSRFRHALPLQGPLVWTTYYLGQYCLTAGITAPSRYRAAAYR